MANTKSNIKVGQVILNVAIFLLPFFLIPNLNNAINLSKRIIVIGTGIITLITFAINSIKNKKISFNFNATTIPLVLFLISTLISTFSGKYPHEHLMGLGGIYLSFVIIALFGSKLAKKKASKTTTLLYISTFILVLLSILDLDLINLGPTRVLNTLFGFKLKPSILLNVSGSPYIAFQLALLSLIGLATNFFVTKKRDIKHIVFAPIMFFGIIYFGYSMLPKKAASISILPMSTSYKVAKKSFVNTKNTLFGYGPESYKDIYSILKPVDINQKGYWNFKFSSGSNLIFTLLPTLGIVGTLSWVLLAGTFFYEFLTQKEKSEVGILLAATFIMQLLAPTAIVILGVQAILLAVWAAQPNVSNEAIFKGFNMQVAQKKEKKTKNDKPVLNQGNISIIMFNIILIVLSFTYTFLLSKHISASHQTYIGTKKLQNNDAIGLYEAHRRSVNLNPYIDTFRRQFAVTNMQIAIAISNKDQITDEDRNTIGQLVSQAVREAKAATQLNPKNSSNWLVLGQIYKELIGTVKGTENLAIEAYRQAIITNPRDPYIKNQLSNILIPLNLTKDAVALLSQAIQDKPDIALTYFNLARSYTQAQDYDKADQALSKTLSLVKKDSQDYQFLMNQFEQLNQLKAQSQTESVDNEPTPQATAPNTNIPTNTVDEAEVQEEGEVNQPMNGPIQIDETTEEVINEQIEPENNTPGENTQEESLNPE